MKFMFPTVYKVTQKDFYAHLHTSMWAPVVARQISKRYSSSCHVFISRGGPTAWPPRSPDFTPLDVFAWGFIKDVVYRRKVRDLAFLRQRTIEAVELITPHMLITRGKSLNII
jgi:hypothetical protein